MAINPLPFITNMPNPGEAFLEAFNQARQQRQQQDRQAQYQQWVQRLRTDRSPETLAEFSLAFPEQAKAVQQAFAPMDEAKKNSHVTLYGTVLKALERGDTDYAKSVAQQQLQAARNTPGEEQYAKELEYGLSLIDSNPDALKTSLASSIYTLNPDAYKELYAVDKAEMTGFQKDLVAAGIDPTSEEGRGKAKEYVSLKVDPIVQMPTPTGGQFIGRQSEYYRQFGGGAPAPQPKDIPAVGTIKNGYRFNGGDPAKPGNWSKVEGGGAGNGAGGFRASGGSR